MNAIHSSHTMLNPISILLFIVILGVVIHTLSVVVYKIRYPFWSKLSGFHTFRWWYWLYKQTILDSVALTRESKYFNTEYVTAPFNIEFDKETFNNFIAFINKHYMNYNDAVYSISSAQLESVYSSTAFLTLCYDINATATAEAEAGSLSPIKGSLLSIPFLMWCKDFKLHGNVKLKYETGNNEFLKINYVDYLCVDEKHRRANVASSIIYTHLANVKSRIDEMRSDNKYINNYDKIQDIYLFKNEGFATKALVPVVDYNGYVIDLDNVALNACSDNIAMLNTYKCDCVRLDPSNTALLNTAMENIYSISKYADYGFDFVSLFPKEIFINHVKSTDVVIYCLMERNTLIGLYLFKDIHSLIDNKTYEFISFCSLNFKHKRTPYYQPFIYGFKLACVLCRIYLTTLRCSNTKYSYGLCCVEEISHNYTIITKVGLNSNNKHKYKIPLRYYTYNGLIHTKQPSKILIIS